MHIQKQIEVCIAVPSDPKRSEMYVVNDFYFQKLPEWKSRLLNGKNSGNKTLAHPANGYRFLMMKSKHRIDITNLFHFLKFRNVYND